MEIEGMLQGMLQGMVPLQDLRMENPRGEPTDGGPGVRTG
jgi:hypothetical protein